MYDKDVIARHYTKQDLELLAVASAQIKGIALEVCKKLERKEGTIFKFYAKLGADQSELDEITWGLLFPGIDFSKSA